MSYYSNQILQIQHVSSTSVLNSFLKTQVAESLMASSTSQGLSATPIQHHEWTIISSDAGDVSATIIMQLPVIPDENPPNVPTYVFIATVVLIILLLAAIATLVAATLYCRHNKMKYEEQEAAIGDLFPSNKVVNNPLYIGVNTLEKIAEQHNQKQHSKRPSSLIRDDVSIAQCSSSGSEVSTRSDEPIVTSTV